MYTKIQDTATATSHISYCSNVAADAGSGYVHTITGTSANMHDVSETANLIRKDDEVVYGDSGYLGGANQPAIKYDGKNSGLSFG